MTNWQKFCNWWAKYWGVILGIFGAIAGVVVTLMFKRRQAACERAETAQEIADNEKDIAKVQGKREANRERILRVDEQIAKLNTELEDETRRLKARREDIKDMTLEQKVEHFKKLGY